MRAALIFAMLIAADAARALDCARVRLTRVQITTACVGHDEDCFADVLIGDAKKTLHFRTDSDGSREEIGYSTSCESLHLDGRGGPVNLPAGCEVSVDFGGEAGARGAKCVCTGRTCRADGD